MFSFYKLLEYLEERDLQEIGGGVVLGGIATILGLRHVIKKGKERDAIMYCKSECSRIMDRKEWEKCVVDCYNRKITITQHSYKTTKKKKVSEVQNINSFNLGDKTPNSPGKTLASDKLRSMVNVSPWSSPRKVKEKSQVSVVGGQ
jgi:hypothetical protein